MDNINNFYCFTGKKKSNSKTFGNASVLFKIEKKYLTDGPYKNFATFAAVSFDKSLLWLYLMVLSK